MKIRSWIGTGVLLSLLVVGGLVISSTPELEINVSSTAGYQGQADVAVDPTNPLALVVAGADDSGSGPTVWSSVDGGATYSPTALPLLFDAHAFAEGSEPSVAVDNDGIWYAAYEVHDLDGCLNPIDSSLVVARSFDGLVCGSHRGRQPWRRYKSGRRDASPGHRHRTDFLHRLLRQAAHDLDPQGRHRPDGFSQFFLERWPDLGLFVKSQ
jgi:hypothetical protein